MKIEDVKFGDAVFQIPTNTVSITMNVKIFQDGEIHELEAEYNTEDIRAAFALFEKTEAGDYPLYKLSDDFLKKMIKEGDE